MIYYNAIAVVNYHKSIFYMNLLSKWGWVWIYNWHIQIYKTTRIFILYNYCNQKLFTHLTMQPTNTSKIVIRGQKDMKLVSKNCSGLYSVLSEKVQRTRQKLSTRAQYRVFSSFLILFWKVESLLHNLQSFCKGLF